MAILRGSFFSFPKLISTAVASNFQELTINVAAMLPQQPNPGCQLTKAFGGFPGLKFFQSCSSSQRDLRLPGEHGLRRGHRQRLEHRRLQAEALPANQVRLLRRLLLLAETSSARGSSSTSTPTKSTGTLSFQLSELLTPFLRTVAAVVNQFFVDDVSLAPTYRFMAY